MDDTSPTQSSSSSGLTTNKMEKSSDTLAPTPRDASGEGIQAEQRGPPMNEYPEGGAQAWLAVAGATACLFVSFGWVNVIGVFQEYYQANQLRHYTPSEIAWIPSLQSTLHTSTHSPVRL